MGNLLSTYTSSRDNNFNLIRFVAASLVLFSHSFALAIGTGDVEPLRSTVGMTLGAIAVDIFFVSSGFLITSSFCSRNNLISFLWARILRIYPGLIVAVFFCVFCVGLVFTTHSVGDYVTNPQTLKLLLKNSILFFGIEDRLPGVFLDVPYREAVNGSLWTLPYEVWMYVLLVLVLSSVTYFGSLIKVFLIRHVTLLIAVVSVFLNVVNNFHTILPEAFVRLFSMFFVGVAFYVWKDRVRLSPKIMSICFPLLVVSALNKDVFFVLYSVLLPFLIFYLAYIPSGFIRKFNYVGDYSYGIYIYAFPVQQSIAAIIPNVSVSTMIALSFACTLMLAVLSWHLVEKRFLKMKGSYTFIEKVVRKVLTMRFAREQ